MRHSFAWTGIRRVPLLAFLISMTAVTPVASRAAEPVPAKPVTDHEQRIRELEETVDRLKKDTRQVEVTVENQKPLAGWTDGFILASQDGKYKLKIGAYTQFDSRFFASDEDHLNTSQFVFRRVRPSIEGTVFKYFDFKIMPDFAGANFTLFDTHVDVNYFKPYAQVRVGKFKSAVGLERLQSARALPLMERGQPTNLVPIRDVGIDVFGEFVDGAIGYRLGIYDGSPDLANINGDVNDDKDFGGRLFFHPLRPTGIAALAGFGVGIGGTYGYAKGSPSDTDLTSGYRSFSQARIFRYVSAPSGQPPTAANTAFAKGTRARINPSADYYYGPFGLLAEYVSSTQGVTLQKRKNITNDAWTVGLSYLLTGENAAYDGAKPLQPFDPFDGKWGAWETVFRASRLHIDHQAFAQGFASPNNSVNEALEFAVGLNWYLNKNIKASIDFAKTSFDGGAAKGADRHSEYAIGGRLQLAL
jgi:phosphate-selective porin OprO/OprP